MVGTSIQNVLRDGTRDRRTPVGSKYPECQEPTLLLPKPGVPKKLLPIGPTSEPLLHDDSHCLPAVGASVGRRLLNHAQRPAFTKCTQSPRANAWHRSSNCFRVTLPLRGGRNKIVLGRSMNNFHARWTLMKSPLASPKNLSFKATRNAALNAPPRNTGGLHHHCTHPRPRTNHLCRPPQQACLGHLTHARCC